MAASAVTLKGEIRDGVSGARISFGTFTLNPASIADNAQGIETAAVTCNVGDMVFVNAQGIALGVAVVGAKVTATNELSVYINNESGGAIDLGSLTWNWMVIHLS